MTISAATTSTASIARGSITSAGLPGASRECILKLYRDGASASEGEVEVQRSSVVPSDRFEEYSLVRWPARPVFCLRRTIDRAGRVARHGQLCSTGPQRPCSERSEDERSREAAR